ncbi:reverse transcriptase domain-containing protein [Tanacetum coccineum]
MDLKQSEMTEAKSSIEEPPELELKDLPSHLEYAFLEENDKLPIIIAKGLKNDEKDALLKVLKSHKRAIAWKITDIKGIKPRFCTHKILIEDDYKPTVQSQRRVNPKIHETLKNKLTKAPILLVPDWNLPFKLMCDASDFAIGAVLGQQKMKHFQPIHYANKTMTEAQIHYTTTEKEMLAVVYAFEKFRPYLVLSKSIVYTDHSALKYLINKQDATPRLLRLANPHKDVLENKDINEHFPLETLGVISSENTPWFADYANYHAGNFIIRIQHQQKENLQTLNRERRRKLTPKNQNRIFNVGDRVLLFNSRLTIFSGKLKTRWSGPFTITKVFPYGTVELSQPDGPNFKVNGHRVKHYFGGDLPPKEVQDLHTLPKDK